MLSSFFFFILHKNGFLKTKNFLIANPFFIIGLMIFISSLISYNSVASQELYLKTNIIILMNILISFNYLLYQIIYSWRGLPMSFNSFIFFMINILQFFLYLLSFNIIMKGLNYPIYIENLSRISQYRYFILFIISIFFLLCFLITKFFKFDISFYIVFFSFPYLKEQVRLFLYSWNNSFMGDFCVKLIDLLYSSFLFRICFFVLHFILFYFLRFFITVLLFYCVFYNEDLRNLIYMAPVMFVVWILSFFNYYFITFQQGCSNYIRSLISANLENKHPKIWGLVKTKGREISFILTEKGRLMGYSDVDMYHLTKEWHIQAKISTYFQIYFNIMTYLNYFILLIQIIIWYYITQKFFFFDIESNISISTLMASLRNFGKVLSRPYVTEARRVLPPHQSDLANATKGVHHGNHLALIDPAEQNPNNSKEVLYEGQPTHGKGSLQNPSQTLHPSKDFQGQSKP